MTSTPKSVEDALGGMRSIISAMNRLMRICVYVNVDSNTCYFRIYTIEKAVLCFKTFMYTHEIKLSNQSEFTMFHVI